MRREPGRAQAPRGTRGVRDEGSGRVDADDVNRSAWTPAHRDLWRRLAAHDFEPDGQALTFTARLARDRGWSLAFARGAVDEYRRFCFLAAVSPAPVTPSEEVDEVWHQHLTHSRDYWTRWCREALRVDLHHDPTAGGSAERSRFATQYADTLALYETWFGPPAPAFWPGTARRFGGRPRFRTVDRDRGLVVPLPAGARRVLRRFGGLLGAGVLLTLSAPDPARALPANPLDWTAGPFLKLYVGLAFAALAGTWFVRTYVRFGPRRARGEGLDVVRLAYLSGGPVRAADAVVLGFLDARAASLSDDGRIAVRIAWADLPDHLEPFRGCGSGLESRKILLKHVTGRLAPVRDDLAAGGLLLGARAAAALDVAALALVGSVVALGGLEVGVGLSRDEPVGLLVTLMVMTVAAALIVFKRDVVRTGVGDRVLAGYRARHARAARAPTAAEVVLAFALHGPVTLAGTAHAGYARLISPAAGAGSEGGGGGCGGCGGAGD